MASRKNNLKKRLARLERSLKAKSAAAERKRAMGVAVHRRVSRLAVEVARAT